MHEAETLCSSNELASVVRIQLLDDAGRVGSRIILDRMNRIPCFAASLRVASHQLGSFVIANHAISFSINTEGVLLAEGEVAKGD